MIVPQGSILGPLLFTMFINDLPIVTDKCKVILYADDTALLYSDKNKTNLENVLNQKLSNVTNWLDQNKLTLNTSKTKIMVIGNNNKTSSQLTVEIKVNTHKLDQVSEFKYLGVWIDDKMKFSTHISKISTNIGILNIARNYLSFKHKNMLFNALVLPHFNYCSNSWSTTNQKYTNILETLQRKAAKLILNLPKRPSPTQVYKQLNWLPLEDRWKINRCSTVNKCLNKQTPDYIHDHFHLTKDTHNHNTRSASNNKLTVPKFRTKTGQRSLKFQGAIDYNNIPSSLYCHTTHQTFKIHLKHHILSAY